MSAGVAAGAKTSFILGRPNIFAGKGCSVCCVLCAVCCVLCAVCCVLCAVWGAVLLCAHPSLLPSQPFLSSPLLSSGYGIKMSILSLS